ncbi:hypothetical protein B0T17DRAFT_95242 [Bombardia bombarda]|uniref:Uncharacterized protein n=1 Tax=Bombardia bombarda TaxID=252184 RepID=A0AA39XN32_9PEZI|nr:hypothetical protein B0T17DRAFT_95242 [Bombardia bombarda]
MTIPWHRKRFLKLPRSDTETVPKQVSKLRSFVHPRIWSSQFPGGEATRVHTPPLKEDTADGRPRGMFFDVNGAGEANGSGSTTSTWGTKNTVDSPSSRKQKQSSDQQRQRSPLPQSPLQAKQKGEGDQEHRPRRERKSGGRKDREW